MPRAEAGSVKAVGNAMKAKGLTKLRFYCQICQKACRDENGYKCHVESESHMRQIAALGSNAGKVIDNFSKEFQDGFVSLLSRRFGTARVNANKVYQEYIQERHHLHMNATRWVSLSEFVKHLGREGIAKVEEITDEGQFGWYVSWIDNSPAALARQDALQKMERAKMDEEGRMRKFLKEQIERANEKEKQVNGVDEDELAAQRAEQGLKREDGQGPLKIGISLGGSRLAANDPVTKTTSSDTQTKQAQPSSAVSFLPSSTPAPAPFKLANNPLKMKTGANGTDKETKTSNLGHAFKSSRSAASKPPSTPATSAANTRGSSMTAAERIMAEEQSMREKRRSMGPQPSAKRMRM